MKRDLPIKLLPVVITALAGVTLITVGRRHLENARLINWNLDSRTRIAVLDKEVETEFAAVDDVALIHSECPTYCYCQAVKIVCDGRIPDIIPFDMEVVFLKNIAWGNKLHDRKRFCSKTWQNVINLRIEGDFYSRSPLNITLDCLSQLKSLVLARVELTFNENSFRALSNLTSLDLSCEYDMSELLKIFTVKTNLPKLTHLDISANFKYKPSKHRIFEMNQAFIDALSLRQIQFLDISYIRVNLSFSSLGILCNHLKTILVQDSKIITNSRERIHCESLEILDFSGSDLLQNQINESCVNRTVSLAFSLGIRFPSVVKANRMIPGISSIYEHQLSILNCKLQLDPDSATKELYFAGNTLSKFEFIFDISTLTHIDLSYCRITSINQNVFTYLPNLERINLSNNKLNQISSLFRYNPLLISIDISSNELTNVFGGLFLPNVQLKEIYIAHNLLTQIHFRVSHLLNLTVLDLRNNDIQSLDSTSRFEIEELYKRQVDARIGNSTNETVSILLDGNPFSCKCDNFEFLIWIDSSPIFSTVKHTLHCDVGGENVALNISAVLASVKDCQSHSQTYIYYIYLKYIYLPYTYHLRDRLDRLLSEAHTKVCSITILAIIVIYFVCSWHTGKLLQQRLEEELRLLQEGSFNTQFGCFLSYDKAAQNKLTKQLYQPHKTCIRLVNKEAAMRFVTDEKITDGNSSTTVLCMVPRNHCFTPDVLEKLIRKCITVLPATKTMSSSCKKNLYKLTVFLVNNVIHARIVSYVDDDKPSSYLCQHVREILIQNLKNVLTPSDKFRICIQCPQFLSTDGGGYLDIHLWDNGDAITCKHCTVPHLLSPQNVLGSWTEMPEKLSNDDDQPITDNHLNHARLCNALVTVCADGLREILLNQVPPGYNNFYGLLAARKPQITRMKQFRQEQINTMFPDPKKRFTGTVDQFDITLLYSLIRNISSVAAPLGTGWGQQPVDVPRDSSLGASAERIRLLRNEIVGHSVDYKLEDQKTFEDHWDKINHIMSDIENLLGFKGYMKALEERKKQAFTLREARLLQNKFKDHIRSVVDELDGNMRKLVTILDNKY